MMRTSLKRERAKVCVCVCVCVFMVHEQGWPEPYMYGVLLVFLAGKSPNIQCIHTVLANPLGYDA
jgi:hypothetical protein